MHLWKSSSTLDRQKLKLEALPNWWSDSKPDISFPGTGVICQLDSNWLVSLPDISLVVHWIIKARQTGVSCWKPVCAIYLHSNLTWGINSKRQCCMGEQFNHFRVLRKSSEHQPKRIICYGGRTWRRSSSKRPPKKFPAQGDRVQSVKSVWKVPDCNISQAEMTGLLKQEGWVW